MTQNYNVVSGQWEVKAKMPKPCPYGSAAVVKEKIYVIGGGSRCCMSYSPTEDTWSVHSLPKQPRNYCAAVVWKGKIILGGGGGKNDLEKYDTGTNKWSTWQPALPVGMNFHTLITVNKFIQEA